MEDKNRFSKESNGHNDDLDDENENEKDDKKSLKLILLFIIVFVMLFLGVYFGIRLYNEYLVDKPVETTTEALQESTTNEQGLRDNPIDFASLQAQNDEIYAYIKINDTKVDYPIVQSPTDDSFYLRHRAEDKAWSASGAVYTEMANSKDFSDSITVIYGHNGYGDTFFTTLHKFEKQDFFNEHPYFHIYTPNRILTYQVMSAFKYDDRHILNSYRFSDTAQLLEFQQEILNPTSALKNTRQDLDVPIGKDSKIVILSTCITNQKSSRYLVCGVLVKDEKTN